MTNPNTYTDQLPHDYLSTACTHNRCTDCRTTCKYCGNTCLCYCHTEPDPARDVCP